MINVKRSFLERLFSKAARELAWQRRYSMLSAASRPTLLRGHLTTFDLCAAIPRGDCGIVWDVGANRGRWTQMCRTFFPQSEYTLFEPIPSLAASLKNDLPPSDRVFEVALSDSIGRSKFYKTSNVDSSSLLAPTSQLEQNYGIRLDEQFEVETITAEHLIDSGLLQCPQLVKLDVQGAEISVLRGFGRHLQNVKYIISEISFATQYQHQCRAWELMSYLNQSGFSLWTLGSETSIGYRLIETDALFIQNGLC